jgi:hypothetical protein
MKFPKQLYLRLIVIFIIAIACFFLSLKSTATNILPFLEPSPEIITPTYAQLFSSLNHDIDSVLRFYAIRDYWVKKKIQVISSDSSVQRILMDVYTPIPSRNDTLLKVVNLTLLNKSLQEVAQNNYFTASARQDLKNNTITTSIDFDGILIEKLTLSKTKFLPPPPHQKIEKKRIVHFSSKHMQKKIAVNKSVKKKVVKKNVVTKSKRRNE